MCIKLLFPYQNAPKIDNKEMHRHFRILKFFQSWMQFIQIVN